MSERQKPDFTVHPEKIKAMVDLALDRRRQKYGIFHNDQDIPVEQPLIDKFLHYERQQANLPEPFRKDASGFTNTALFLFLSCLFSSNSELQVTITTQSRYFQHNAWVFQPDRALRRDDATIIEAATEIIRPGHPLKAILEWPHNLRVLQRDYDGKIDNLFAKHDYNASAILEEIIGPKKKLNHPGLHRFRHKLACLYLFMVHSHHLADLKGISEIGIPVDFQVSRLVIQTGGINMEQPVHKYWIQDKTLIPLFIDLVKEGNYDPLVLSDTLWRIGHFCCNKKLHQFCPLECLCDRLVAYKPLKKKGLFDPQDTGRWKNTKHGQLA